MKLGARIFKTGLAIILAIYAARWIGLEPAFFAAISATFAIQPSIYKTYQTIIDQIQANVIGAIIAIVLAVTFGHEPVIIGAGVMLAIGIILKLKLDTSSISLALVTIIIIMGNPDDSFLLFAGERFSLVMLGVLSAFFVNLVFLPPKHETKIYHKTSNLTEEVIRWTRLITRHETNQHSLKQDIPRINESIITLDHLYLLYKEERNYFLKSKFGKARKLVVYKQMIIALKKIHSILRTFDKYENELTHMPESMQKIIREQLDHLTDYHDRILLRYIGKVNTQLTEEMGREINAGKVSMTDSFMYLYDNGDIKREEWLHLLPIVSHIMEYNEQLDHLDRLVESFFSYHQEDNEIHVEDEVDI
ncbi:aromatic acid exporter family protein [Salibacterium salarium]|uniref:Aromatic acid exporter family protein n=1 Tax=Salibacterium salarium TaxID=284579 RepID=A0A3R9QJ57_9BACI|nr:aromatic acid exporter family protein [Salibacterium salarium]RSL31614.1 aromatic acid exporter family protein [Salibacterium salarium]